MQAASQVNICFLGKEEGCRYLCEVFQSRRAVGKRRRDGHPDCPLLCDGLVLDGWNSKSSWDPHGLYLEAIAPRTCDTWRGRRYAVVKFRCWKRIAPRIFKRLTWSLFWTMKILIPTIYFSYEYYNFHEESYTGLGCSNPCRQNQTK